MSTERNKNPLKRDQALNDATNGQLGEQPRPKPLGKGESSESETDKNIRDSRINRSQDVSRYVMLIPIRMKPTNTCPHCKRIL